MLTLTHVEDYLELIAGHRDVKTGKLATNSLSYLISFCAPVISLARYDVNVLQNMITSISNGVGLTERQSHLACKIVLKYRRQLQKLEVDVSPVENPVYRIPIRVMDYSCTMQLVGDHIHIRFPFDSDRITQIREFSKESQGDVLWDRGLRAWVAQISEYNVNWLVSWATVRQFNVDDQILAMFKLITDTEQHGDVPMELMVDHNNELYITDAPDSLMQYIHQHLPTMHLDNALAIIDRCAELAVTVNKTLLLRLIDLHPELSQSFWDLLIHREVKTTDELQIGEIFDYADRVMRWPVVVFEPDHLQTLLHHLENRYSDQQIARNIKLVDSETRCIYTTKPIRNLTNIPLLINKAGLTFGGEKLMMIQQCQKIVYFAPHIYRSNGLPETEVKQLGS
jgi:hypothetical protein